MNKNDKRHLINDVIDIAKQKIIEFLDELDVFQEKGVFFDELDSWYDKGYKHKDGLSFDLMEKKIIFNEKLNNIYKSKIGKKGKQWLEELDRNHDISDADMMRVAMKMGEYEVFIDKLEYKVDYLTKNFFLKEDIAAEIINWGKVLNPTNVELIYEPFQHGIIVPKLIIEANDALIARISKDKDALYTISPRKFEEIIAEIFNAFGYHVELTARTRDGGRDIIAVANNMDIFIKIIIECKRYAMGNKIGISHVQRLLGVKIAERANKGLLVTTASFTAPARKFESDHFYDLELKDYNTVLKWANEYTMLNKNNLII